MFWDRGKQVFSGFERFKIELDRAAPGHHGIPFIPDFLVSLTVIWIFARDNLRNVLSPIWNFIYKIRSISIGVVSVPGHPPNEWGSTRAWINYPWVTRSGEGSVMDRSQLTYPFRDKHNLLPVFWQFKSNPNTYTRRRRGGRPHLI